MCNFPDDINDILLNIGVPNSAYPFIYFLSEEEGALKGLDKYYVLSEEDYTKDFIRSMDEFFKKYIVIAKTTGHAICFNEKKEIVYIDYGDYTEFFINNTIEEFLECIICYDNMVNNVKERYTGNIDYLDYLTNEDISKLRDRFITIFNDSLEKYDFWNCSIEFLEEQIDY